MGELMNCVGMIFDFKFAMVLSVFLCT